MYPHFIVGGTNYTIWDRFSFFSRWCRPDCFCCFFILQANTFFVLLSMIWTSKLIVRGDSTRVNTLEHVRFTPEFSVLKFSLCRCIYDQYYQISILNYPRLIYCRIVKITLTIVEDVMFSCRNSFINHIIAFISIIFNFYVKSSSWASYTLSIYKNQKIYIIFQIIIYLVYDYI